MALLFSDANHADPLNASWPKPDARLSVIQPLNLRAEELEQQTPRDFIMLTADTRRTGATDASRNPGVDGNMRRGLPSVSRFVFLAASRCVRANLQVWS